MARRVDTRMETIDFTSATKTMQQLVTQVTDDQLTAPTPCEKYTVGDLVDHIGGLTVAFTGAARKEPVPGSEEGGSGDATRLEDGWREQTARDLDTLAEAWRDPAAYDGETMAGPVRMPGSEAAVVALNELIIHGWDLATAIGADYSPAETDVAICLEFARAFSTPETADMRGDAFGKVIEVPADASPLVQLLGMMGRRG